MNEEQKERIKKYFDTAEYSLHLFDRTTMIAGIKSNDKDSLVDCIYHLRKSVIALYNILQEQYPDIDIHSISIK